MDMKAIMKQAQAMQKKMEDMQQKLGEKIADGQAGGGLVKVTVSGKGELKKIDINPELLKPEEKEVLQDLIIAAFNDGKNKVESDFNSSMAGLAGELGLPPGFKLPT